MIHRYKYLLFFCGRLSRLGMHKVKVFFSIVVNICNDLINNVLTLSTFHAFTDGIHSMERRIRTLLRGITICIYLVSPLGARLHSFPDLSCIAITQLTTKCEITVVGFANTVERKCYQSKTLIRKSNCFFICFSSLAAIVVAKILSEVCSVVKWPIWLLRTQRRHDGLHLY